jgi:hypothetical protein
MRTRTLIVLVVGIACLIATAPTAFGGGPSPGLTDGHGALTQGKERYVTVPSGGATSLRVISPNSGRVLRTMKIRGTWGIPYVAFDGTVEGLLPDGRTLVLGQSVINGDALRVRTSFLLVDTRKMRIVRTIMLKGAFAFDALSPDAHYMYLVEYVSQQDFSSYRVRAYDLKANRLLAKIVADRKSWETAMQGSPVSRLNRDGWAYTLYGGSARPFIHALDTRHVEAVCIDMPWKTSPKHLFDYRLRSDGDGHLVVRGPRGRALAVIDRSTFRVISFVRDP